MPYQQTSTPRFYVDHGLWLYSLGEFIPPADQVSLFQLNPSNVVEKPLDVIQIPRVCPMRYCAFLGHNRNAAFYNDWFDGAIVVGAWGFGYEDIINAPSPIGQDNGVLPDFSGFSISTFDDNDISPNNDTWLRAIINQENVPEDSPLPTIGAVSMGNFYDFSHSADLRLSLSYDYSGTKTIETKGGASLSNSFWSKPPMWGDLGAWELKKPDVENDPTTEEDETLTVAQANQKLSRSGRRVWDLSFSYLSQEDTFPKYNQLTTLATDDEPTGYTGETDTSRVNILPSSDDFYSQVIHKTNGGQLPFIFQPNKDDNTLFAICKLDSDFKFDQVANGVYNCKIRVREIW